MRHMIIAAAALVPLLLSLPALAQSVPPPQKTDARLAQPTIDALQALLALREAEMRALSQDMTERLARKEKEWADYARPLYDPPPAPQAEAK